jgi:hypothetical protein
MANPTLEKPPGPQAPENNPKPNMADALKRIFTSDDPDPQRVVARRRRFVMAGVSGFLTVNLLMFLRFFFPRALYEPKTKFLIGYPSDFGFGVDTKFQNAHRIWVVRNTEGIFVISAICTHLGCTRIGSRAKINSSAPVMARAMIRRASTSKVRRRVPWTARTSSCPRKVR